MKRAIGFISSISIVFASLFGPCLFGSAASATPQDISWVGIAGGDNPQLVAFGEPNGQPLFVDLMNANPPMVETSPDGTTWTAHSLPTGEVWSSVKWLNGKFVATGWFTGPMLEDQEPPTIGIIMTSTNGVDWGVVNSTTTNPATLWFSVAYGNGKYVALDEYGKIATSLDGTNWTIQSSLPGRPESLSILFANGKFVAIGNNFSATSDNGDSWTMHPFSGNDYWTNLSYGNGRYVATSNGSTNSFATSVDGAHWTFSNFGNGRWFGLTFANDEFIAVGLAGGATSLDGSTWSAMPLPDLPDQSSADGGNYWYSITSGNGTLLTAMESCHGTCLAIAQVNSGVALTQSSGTTVEVQPGAGSVLGADGSVTSLSVSAADQSVALSAGGESVSLAAAGSAFPQVPGGASMSVDLTGYQPNSTVDVWVNSKSVKLGSASIDGSGAARLTIVLPPNLSGKHTLQIQGFTSTGILQAINYGVDLKAKGWLASTGVPVIPIGLLSIFLISIGVVLSRIRVEENA